MNISLNDGYRNRDNYCEEKIGTYFVDFCISGLGQLQILFPILNESILLFEISLIYKIPPLKCTRNYSQQHFTVLPLHLSSLKPLMAVLV